MSFNRQGLKRVVKTVRTKRGTKRQVFWVRADGGAQKPGLLRRAAGLAGKAALGAAALGVAAYGAHKYVSSGKAGQHASALRDAGRHISKHAGSSDGRWLLRGQATRGLKNAASSVLGRAATAGNNAVGSLQRAGGGTGTHHSERTSSFGGSSWGSGGEKPKKRRSIVDGMRHALNGVPGAGRNH